MTAKKYLTILLIIPICALFLGLFFEMVGEDGTIIQSVEYVPIPSMPNYVFKGYTADFQGYITNLNTLFSTSMLDRIIPKIPVGNFGADVGHNFKLIVNWIIYLANILTIPHRIGGNILGTVLSILGINVYTSTQNGMIIGLRTLMIEPFPYQPI